MAYPDVNSYTSGFTTTNATSTISPVGITSAEIFGTAITHGGVHTYSQMVSVSRELGRRTQTEGGYRVPTEHQGGVATERVRRVSETKYSGVIR